MVKVTQNTQKQESPKNAQAISLILQSMGVTDLEPRVIHQLLDLTYRTTIDFLETAQTLSEHRNAAEIEVDDIKLAIQRRIQTEFTGPPSRELLMKIAEEKNKEPLPLMSEKFGVRLPAGEKGCLTQPNYVVLGKKNEK